MPCIVFHVASGVDLYALHVTHVWQALRSRQKLREFLGAHLFRALCSAHVSHSAYADADVPGNSGIEPTEGGWPCEEVVHQLLFDTTAEGETRNGFDYGVFRLLWPRRDLSTLEDLTRLVVIFKTLLVEGGHGRVRLYIDLLYRTGAGGADAPDGPDHTQRLRYRERLWTASQMADILLEAI